MLFHIIAFIRYFVFQCYSKDTAFSKLTLYLYCSTEQIYIFLYNRHSQSGSRDFALCGILLTRERFENLCQEIFTHAYSGIAYSVSHYYIPRLVAWQFIYTHYNRTTGWRIFYGIAQNIDKYFFYFGRICQYMLMFYIYRVMKCKILFLCFIFKYFKQRLPDSSKPAIILIDLHLSALNLGHIKYIIYN